MTSSHSRAASIRALWVRYKPLLLLILALGIGSCSPSLPNVIVLPEYAGRDVDGSSLVVAPFYVTILNTDDLRDDLGEGDAREVYQSFARPILIHRLQQYSHFANVVVDSYRGKRSMYPRRLQGVSTFGMLYGLGGEIGRDSTLHLNLPRDGDTVRFHTAKADYVLFLSSFNVYRNERTTIRSSYAPPGTGGGGVTVNTERTLIQQTHFAFWDNNTGQLMAYGSARSSEGVVIAMTDKTWKKGLEKLAKEILRKTPFYTAPSRRKHRSD